MLLTCNDFDTKVFLTRNDDTFLQDLVPEEHQYILIMLLYIGVGLAVTTMCIDLVGANYIEKVHYFGRKFKGTDILQYWRRKKMLEELAATDEGQEILQMYWQQMNQQKYVTLLIRPRSAFLKIYGNRFVEDSRRMRLHCDSFLLVW